MDGFKSLHPTLPELLRKLGLEDNDVTQGYGNAPASAGYHKPCGLAGGEPYSDCFDLRFNSVGDEQWARLVAQQTAVFPRYVGSGWHNSEHIHCVKVGLRDDEGKCRILPGPQAQILDWLRGRNGLVRHGLWRGKWFPTTHQVAELREAYEAWVPNHATRVYKPSGETLLCYAWEEQTAQGQRVFAEIRPLLQGLGLQIIAADDFSGHWMVFAKTSAGETAKIVLPFAYSAQGHLRAPVRDIAEALGLRVNFMPSEDRTFTKLYLGDDTPKPPAQTTPHTDTRRWRFKVVREGADLIAEGFATVFNDHDTRTGVHADAPGVLGCALPRGLCALTMGSGFEGVPDKATVRVWNPANHKQVEVPVIDEGPAQWAQAGTGVPGSAMIDLTPAAFAAVGLTDNGKVRIRVLGGAR